MSQKGQKEISKLIRIINQNIKLLSFSMNAFTPYIVLLIFSVFSIVSCQENAFVISLSSGTLTLIVINLLLELYMLRQQIQNQVIISLLVMNIFILTSLQLLLFIFVDQFKSNLAIIFYLFQIQYSVYKRTKQKYSIVFKWNIQLLMALIFALLLYRKYDQWLDWSFLIFQQPIAHYFIHNQIQKQQDYSGKLETGHQIIESTQPNKEYSISEPRQTIQLLDLLNFFPFGLIVLNKNSKISNINFKAKKYLNCQEMQQMEAILSALLLKQGQFNYQLSVYKQKFEKYNSINDIRQRTKTISPNILLQQDLNRQLRKSYIFRFKQHVKSGTLIFNQDQKKQRPLTFKKLTTKERNSSALELAQMILLNQKQQNQMINGKGKKEDQPSPCIKVKHLKRILSIHIFEVYIQIADKNKCPLNDQKEMHVFIILENATNKESYKMMNERHQFKSLLLNSFSHELRTPLNCSLQLQQMLYTKVDEDLKQNYLKPSIINISRLSHQLNDILDYASLEANSFQLKITLFPLNYVLRIIKDYYQLECEQKSINLKFKIIGCHETEVINNDPERIIQILVNLMNNAIKFTKQSGMIQITVNKRKKSYLFSVIDDGVGINLDRLFTIQTIIKQSNNKIQNTELEFQQYVGLGLKISNSIAGYLRKKGQLQLESQEDKYTDVSFAVKNFPEKLNRTSQMFSEFVIDEAQRPLKSKELFLAHRNIGFPPKKIRCSCKNVLICDDVPFNHIALETLLKNFKIYVDNAYDGQQALDKIRSRNENTQCRCQYKLIFMDIQMPIMDGFEATEKSDQILKIDQEIIIIMCSAYDSKQNMEQSKKCGMKEILEKPVKLIQLQQILQKYESYL